MPLNDQQLQSLRNLGNDAEYAADELQQCYIEIDKQSKVIARLKEAVKNIREFLSHCWRDVNMDAYSFELLDRRMNQSDMALAELERNARVHNAPIDEPHTNQQSEISTEQYVVLEPVAWQQRYLCPDEGPSIWQHCNDSDAKVLEKRSDYELRRMYVIGSKHA